MAAIRAFQTLSRTTISKLLKGGSMRTVILTAIEDGWWLAEVPSLPGCLTEGETKAEALENIKEAITGYIESLEMRGLPIPEEVEVELAAV